MFDEIIFTSRKYGLLRVVDYEAVDDQVKEAFYRQLSKNPTGNTPTRQDYVSILGEGQSEFKLACFLNDEAFPAMYIVFSRFHNHSIVDLRNGALFYMPFIHVKYIASETAAALGTLLRYLAWLYDKKPRMYVLGYERKDMPNVIDICYRWTEAEKEGRKQRLGMTVAYRFADYMHSGRDLCIFEVVPELQMLDICAAAILDETTCRAIAGLDHAE